MRCMIIIAFVLLIVNPSNGASIYVDQLLGGNCAGGNGTSYRIANRDCGGSDGTKAYVSVQNAIDIMNIGDKVFLRGGTYYVSDNADGKRECIHIPTSKNGTAWTEGNYNTLSSYPGEWAILDGGNSCGEADDSAYPTNSGRGVLIGNYDANHSSSSDIKYWLFERLEIRNSRSAPNGQFSYGIFVNGGPNKFRWLYVHDNTAADGSNNPAGLCGYHWTDVIVEYSFFSNNGTVVHDRNKNAAHIMTFSDYNSGYWLQNGYSGGSSAYVGSKRNTIRYNLFIGSTSGYKIKAYQAFSGRNSTGGHPISDTYRTWGDNVHHNIFKNISYAAVFGHQDFIQVHHNIMDTCGIGAILCYEINYSPVYKATTYNNTMIDIRDWASTTQGSGGVIHIANRATGAWEDATYYAYDYNNILDNVNGTQGYCTNRGISVNGSSACWPNGNYNVGQYTGSNNYFYRPPSALLYAVSGMDYTKLGYSAQSVTHAPRSIYSNSYNPANPLWRGTTGADRYLPYGTHTIESGVLISNGGLGGSHPYLAGVSIPSYVGAVNPSDSDWVSGVLSLSTISVLQSGSSGDPTWAGGDSGDPANDDGGGSSTAASSGGGGCFIATVAFGSFDDSHVMILREFRDKILLQTDIGRSFVSFYYSISPSIADCVSKHEILKTAIKWCLMPLVYVCWLTMKTNIALTFCLIAALIFLTIQIYSVCRRKLKRVSAIEK